jgi:hypothetical protein
LRFSSSCAPSDIDVVSASQPGAAPWAALAEDLEDSFGQHD